jgi:hypothetical protein
MNKLVIGSLISAIALMAGCGGSSGGNGGGGGGQQGVTVSLAPSGTVNVAVTFTQQFTATVTGTSNAAVNWTVSGSGCSGSACGMISSNGLYTAPASIPSPATVTVTATSAADSAKSASATVKVVGITVGVVPSTATVALMGTQQFSAQVSPASPVTWTVSGTGCSGATCGTVDSSGKYTAPASLPSPATVTVTATSSIQSTASAKATVTLVSTPNSRFTGQFAFRFSGSDASGPVYAAGIFTTNGAGAISAGIEDVSRASGNSQLTFTGTYSVGLDNRGTMTITDSNSGTFTYDFAVGASGEAVLAELDSSGTRGGGVMDKADTSAFSSAKIKGAYVMNLFGNDTSGNRVGTAGMFITDGVGAITSGALDTNDAGSATSTSTVTGAYSVGGTGRGTFSTNSVNYAFYIVSANELFIVSTDPPASSNRVVGLAFAQNQTAAPYSNSSFNSPTVFDLNGRSGSGSVAAVGEINPTNNTFSGTFDENNAGTITSSAALSGSFSIAANGRGTFTVTGGSPATSFVVYMINVNAGLVLDISSASVLSGNLEPQSTGAGGVFTAATLQGTFIEGTTTAADPLATNLSGVLSIDGVSAITGTQDTSTSTVNSMGQTVAGTYTVASSGRGTITLTSPSAQQLAFYIVTNGKIVAIDIGSGAAHPDVIVAAR